VGGGLKDICRKIEVEPEVKTGNDHRKWKPEVKTGSENGSETGSENRK